MQTPLTSPDTSRVKIVLYQVRDDEGEKEFERKAFARATGLETTQFRFVDIIADGTTGSELDGADGVIIGGSGYSVFEEVPNVDALKRAIESARERKIPILAVCFGAQLIADMFGGEVRRDQERSELGTVRVSSTDDSFTDMLFADVPFEFDVQAAHRDRITKLPHGGTLLAENEACPIQAFVMPAANIYAVQFHPERTKEDFEWLLENRVPDHYKGADTSGVKAGLRETPEAATIVRKFVERMAAQRRK